MSDEAPVARVRSLGEMAEIVPYLIGFEPQESLVAMVVDGGRVAVTARVDLNEQSLPGVERLMAGIQARYPAAQVFTLAYTDNPEMGWEALKRNEQILGGMAAATVLVNGDTWYSGGQTGAVRRDGPIAAHATMHGLGRAASRNELGQALDSPPDTDARREALQRAVGRLPDRTNTAASAAMLSDLTARYLKDSAKLGPEEAAQLAVLVNLRPEARDAALLGITTENAEQHLRLWSGVIQQVPEEVATPPMILAGMAAWVDGDGATASMAMERLEARGVSEYGMAPLLGTLIANMVNPQEWDQIRGGMLMGMVREQMSAPPAAAQAPVWENVQPSNPNRRPEPPSAAEPPRPGPAI